MKKVFLLTLITLINLNIFNLYPMNKPQEVVVNNNQNLKMRDISLFKLNKFRNFSDKLRSNYSESSIKVVRSISLTAFKCSLIAGSLILLKKMSGNNKNEYFQDELLRVMFEAFVTGLIDSIFKFAVGGGINFTVSPATNLMLSTTRSFFITAPGKVIPALNIGAKSALGSACLQIFDKKGGLKSLINNIQWYGPIKNEMMNDSQVELSLKKFLQPVEKFCKQNIPAFKLYRAVLFSAILGITTGFILQSVGVDYPECDLLFYSAVAVTLGIIKYFFYENCNIGILDSTTITFILSLLFLKDFEIYDIIPLLSHIMANATLEQFIGKSGGLINSLHIFFKEVNFLPDFEL